MSSNEPLDALKAKLSEQHAALNARLNDEIALVRAKLDEPVVTAPIDPTQVTADTQVADEVAEVVTEEVAATE